MDPPFDPLSLPFYLRSRGNTPPAPSSVPVIPYHRPAPLLPLMQVVGQPSPPQFQMTRQIAPIPVPDPRHALDYGSPDTPTAKPIPKTNSTKKRVKSSTSGSARGMNVIPGSGASAPRLSMRLKRDGTRDKRYRVFGQTFSEQPEASTTENAAYRQADFDVDVDVGESGLSAFGDLPDAFGHGSGTSQDNLEYSFVTTLDPTSAGLTPALWSPSSSPTPTYALTPSPLTAVQTQRTFKNYTPHSFQTKTNSATGGRPAKEPAAKVSNSSQTRIPASTTDPKEPNSSIAPQQAAPTPQQAAPTPTPSIPSTSSSSHSISVSASSARLHTYLNDFVLTSAMPYSQLSGIHQFADFLVKEEFDTEEVLEMNYAGVSRLGAMGVAGSRGGMTPANMGLNGAYLEEMGPGLGGEVRDGAGDPVPVPDEETWGQMQGYLRQCMGEEGRG